MVGNIVKSVLKTGIKLGIGGFVVKTIFAIGYYVGQSTTEATFSLINEKERYYASDVLKQHKEIYGNATSLSDAMHKAIECDEELPMDRYTLGNSNFARGALYTARYAAYLFLQKPDWNLQYVVYPHQEHLYNKLEENPELRMMHLELRQPNDFKFNDDIMYRIAFQNNAFYDRSCLSFYGPSINVRQLGTNFWTYYNLIAMDLDLPGIDTGRYTADQFIDLS